jgi:tetratricopeptide (TPR) repeat protein
MKLTFAALLFSITLVVAQTHQHAPPAEEGRVDLARLPAPEHMTGIGTSHIAITTKSSEAQQWFDQGVALLHCFWDYEALRAFEQAVRLDPDCALCHWGVAEALEFRGHGHQDQVNEELAKAKELGAKATDHEQRYIRAANESHDKKGEEAHEAATKEMESLVDHYPDDVEARLFLALSSNGGYDTKGDPRSGALYGQQMLRNLLKEFPESAAANHYWIHAMEVSGHPEWALESAEKLGRLAPASGHMVHMPGHIYYRTGDYERARQIFLDALKVDEDYMAKQHVALRDDWNYAHNISYLIADCAEAGRFIEAREHARTLAGLANDPEHSGNVFFYVLQIGATEDRLAIRFANWDEAIAHPMQFGVTDDKLSSWIRSYRDGLGRYALGMKDAESGHSTEAETAADQLDALLWRLSREKIERDDEKALRDRVLKILGTASLELRGEIAMRKGDLATGVALLKRADDDEKEIGYSEPPQYARPALEVLGAAYIRAGKFSEARAAFNEVLMRRPRSGFALYGLAKAWEEEGKKKEAAEAYRVFLTEWQHADADLPQMRAARDYLAVAAR